jgi:hypothetical protein
MSRKAERVAMYWVHPTCCDLLRKRIPCGEAGLGPYYEPENQSRLALYPVVLRGKNQKPNGINELRFLEMGSSD